jgi:hypothetical protein
MATGGTDRGEDLRLADGGGLDAPVDGEARVGRQAMCVRVRSADTARGTRPRDPRQGVPRPVPSSRSSGLESLGVWDVGDAATLQVVEGVDLAGEFQVISVDWVVPAFDIDAAAVADETELADDVGPVGIA